MLPSILSLDFHFVTLASFSPTISQSTPLFFLPGLPHLRLDVSVVVVLEQQRSRLGVVFAGRDV